MIIIMMMMIGIDDCCDDICVTDQPTCTYMASPFVAINYPRIENKKTSGVACVPLFVKSITTCSSIGIPAISCFNNFI